jgi:SsrA-binding protein
MKISNKRAFYDYEITDRFEAGINLSGAEVKAIKADHADLTGSFVRIIGSEAYLVNAKVFPLPFAKPEGYQEDRTRKLLLHKKEIISLKSKTDGASLTLVPISLYDKHGLIKLEVGVGKGKKKFDKKEAKKRADLTRDIEQELAS